MKKVSLKDLIRPRKVEIESDQGSNRYAKFVIEPLERGYGTTIGNALRRVLLSSLQGAAITAFKVDGVMHEFSTVPGILEDMTEVGLNLKQVVVVMEEKEEAILRLEANTAGEVTAGMFTGDSSVTFVNPELKICTLGEGAKLSLEVHVKSGRGYSVSEKNKVEGVSEGTIFLDSIFSPIRRVNHVVSNARVGQNTDYDKLTLEVWTDGSIEPRVAVAQAGHILVDQLEMFVGDGLIVEQEEPKVEEPKSNLNENLFRRIDEIELSVRSANCLENADIKYMGELVRRSEAEMLRTKNFGRKSLNEIKAILSEMGLGLGMRLDGYPSREELDKRYREAQANK